MKVKDIKLKGKTALVTGGAKRLGRSISLALAEAGVHLIVHYNTSASEAKDLCAELEQKQVKAQAVQADLSDPCMAERFIPEILKSVKMIDFLINNASIYPSNELQDFSVKDFSENMNTNALSPVLLARSFSAQQKEGAIINLLDTRITRYDHKHVAYHASKRMLFSFTKMMALEFAPLIRVNAVAPGLILPPAGKDESYLEALADSNALRQTGRTQDVTQAILFLLQSPFVTGQVIYVDGGSHLRGCLYGGS
jgi:pteridine reductase